MGTTKENQMGNMANTEFGRRIIRGLEEVLSDPTIKMTKKQRAEVEHRLAAWKAAAAK